MPALTLSIGIGTPIRPVDPTRTCWGGICIAPPPVPPSNRRPFNPWRPVQALALPEFTTMACHAWPPQVFQAHFHRRRADLVGGKQTRSDCRNLRHDQRQVTFLAFLRTFTRAEPFDVAENAAGQKAVCGATIPPGIDLKEFFIKDCTWGRRSSHFRPPHRLAGPSARLTAVPPFRQSRTSGSCFARPGRWRPLTRLSSALIKISRPVRGSTRHAISATFVPATFLVSGSALPSSNRTNGSFS
jgi:hypothetical protein